MNYQGLWSVNVSLRAFREAKLIIAVTIISLFLLSSCYPTQYASSSSKFTTDNILKLKVGMSSNEVIAIFGKPIKTSGSTCGGAVGKPWTCITWFYGDYTPSLTFQQEQDGILYLNSWNM